MRRPYSVTSSFPPSCCVQGKAKGYLYTDDGLTLSHEKGVFLYRKFEFNNNQFISSSAEPSGQYKTKEWLERIIVLGLQSKPRRITMKDASGKPLMICSTALLLCVYQPFHVVCLHLPPHGA
jgi:hypothetical protein